MRITEWRDGPFQVVGFVFAGGGMEFYAESNRIHTRVYDRFGMLCFVTRSFVRDTFVCA